MNVPRIPDPPRRSRRGFRQRLSGRLIILGLTASCGIGCVELGLIPPPTNGDTLPPNGTGNGDNGDPAVPAVRLTVSNNAPQPNETLTLRCTVTNNVNGDVAFDFQSGSQLGGRLISNRDTGVATFIVLESDVGVALTVTCTGTNAAGTGPLSNTEVIVATGSSLPPDPALP